MRSVHQHDLVRGLNRAAHPRYPSTARRITARSNYPKHVVVREEAYAARSRDGQDPISMPVWGEASPPHKGLFPFNINRLEEYFSKNLEIERQRKDYRTLHMMYEDLYRYISRGGMDLSQKGKINMTAARFASNLDKQAQFQKFLAQITNGDLNKSRDAMLALINLTKDQSKVDTLEQHIDALPLMVPPLIAVMINPDLCTEEQKLALGLPFNYDEIKTILCNLRSLTINNSRNIFSVGTNPVQA